MSDPTVRPDPTIPFESADGDPLEHLDDHERRPELRRRRRMTSPVTWVLVGAVVAAGAFAIGAKVGDDHGLGEVDAGGATGIGAAAASGRGSPGFGAGGLGGARSAAGASAAGGTGGSGGTVGQVQLVDGTNLYVQTFDGGVVKVTTGPSTTVTALAPSTLANLKVGSTVVVQGSPGPDGTVSATTVSQGGGRGGGFGGGGGGSGGRGPNRPSGG